MSVEKATSSPWLIRHKFATSSVGQTLRASWYWLYDRLWLTLFGLAIPALWPFYQEGLPRSFDGGLHLLRLGVLDYLIRHGTFYPRWTPSLMLGYGYPLFNFYAPSTYYLVELLHLLGFSFYFAFMASFGLLILVAGFGMWLVARATFGPHQPWSALVAATAYMYAPYLLTNVYIRGALAEAGAQALLPWIFWSVSRLFQERQPSRYCLPVALSLGGLAITHNITLLFLPPILLVYMAICWWQGERNRLTLYWAGLSLVLAMGISAFFWLPLVLERHYLADTAYEIAKTVWLPGSVWTWHNFLDAGFVFTHTFARPIRLGLIQLGLAIAGLLLARRRDPVWLFWGVAALLISLLIGAWALPLWLSNDVLPVAQFTWRLLALLSLPLALLTGGLLLPLRLRWQPTVVGGLLLILIVLANLPRLSWMDVFAASSTDVALPVFAQVEVDNGILGGGEGNSSIQEFRPRWVDRTLVLAPAKAQTAPKLDLQLRRGNAYDLDFHVAGGAGGPLRFNNFYFPGWQVMLDQHTLLKIYPSTNLGLLTVDLPAGSHDVQLTWAGTPLATWAGAISLLTLAALTWLTGRQRGWRWLAVVPCALLVFGLTAFIWPRPWTAIETSAQMVEANGVRLLGLRTEQINAGQLYLYPYWYAVGAPSKTLRVEWELLDERGIVKTETLTYPYFNTTQASNWPPGTLVDDAYVLALPPGLPQGIYRIAVRLGATAAEWQQPAHTVGTFTLTSPIPEQTAPPNPLNVQIGDAIRLMGFTATAAGQPLAFVADKPTIVVSGAYVRYTLDWQALAAVAQNYHGFVHLTDIAGRPLVQEDQLPGPFFRPPLLWDRYYAQPDTYLLRIPANAPSGLYWPEVGMYNFATRDRLPVRTAGQATSDDHFRLPPVKIVNPATPTPTQQATAHFGDMASLLGYDLAVPAAGLHAGDHFSVTLYYRSEAATQVDYTRFLHLENATSGMAAQYDSPPQQGGNPTWSWAPGEVIVDRVALQVSAQASPGPYTLYLGFYDPKTNGVRIQARRADGKEFLDDRAIVTELNIRAQ